MDIGSIWRSIAAGLNKRGKYVRREIVRREVFRLTKRDE
jgi:hypothetical protein